MGKSLYEQFREAVRNDTACTSMLDDPSVPFFLKQALVKVRMITSQRRPDHGSEVRDGRGTC